MSIWKLLAFSIIVLPQPKSSAKEVNALIGLWHGNYKQFELSSGGKFKPLKLKKVPRISLCFRADHRGYINYEDSVETLPPSTSTFNYRFLKSNVVVLRNKGYLTYYKFEITNSHRLNLISYPVPVKPQEDVAIITLIDFYKNQ